jgi:hypothetical protein
MPIAFAITRIGALPADRPGDRSGVSAPALRLSASIRALMQGCVEKKPLLRSDTGLSMKKACNREGTSKRVLALRGPERAHPDSWVSSAAPRRAAATGKLQSLTRLGPLVATSRA